MRHPVRHLPFPVRTLLVSLASLAPHLALAQMTVIPSGRPPEPQGQMGPLVTSTDDPFRSITNVDLPAPNSVRDASGSPGAQYWQQRADYTIRATLDTGAKAIEGTVTIRYTNHSPLPLDFVWIQLEQNLFRYADEHSDQEGAKLPGGIDVDHVTVDGKPATLEIHKTMARLDLPRTIAARDGRATIAMHFRFVVPQNAKRRMGRDGREFNLGQWYPRVAVYDDVRGWNTDPYIGDGEFYLEYGDFDYAVTVPAGYTVVGTGLLQNPGDVLTDQERARLARAERDTNVVSIITKDEASARSAQTRTGTKTWRFSARNVRDVAWAAAPDFRWDAVSCDVPGQHVLCQALYTVSTARPSWTNAANLTRFSIQHYSKRFYPYPYPRATSVESAISGMEYPMITFDSYGSDQPTGDFFVLDHELGHQWFPMVVGSNERRYAWMDEGFNSFGNKFSAEALAAARKDTTPRATHADMITGLGWRMEVPLMTGGDHGGMWPAYERTADALLLLRDYVLGPQTFDRAFRTYIKRWAFKHPTPVDFFRTMENVSGEDLGYFWRGFFYSNDVVDYAIDSMVVRADPDGRYVTGVLVKRMTSIPFPLVVRVKFADGTTKDIFRPVSGMGLRPDLWISVWSRSPAVGARLWPHQGESVHPDRRGFHGLVPDQNRWNDVWGDAPDPEPGTPAFGQ